MDSTPKHRAMNHQGGPALTTRVPDQIPTPSITMSPSSMRRLFDGKNDQPFTAPLARPLTKYFCNARKSTTIGRLDTIEPAAARST